jgi:hypothetical protein
MGLEEVENTAFRTSRIVDLTACCKLNAMPGQTTRKAPGKVKLTVSLSRSAVAALDRIAAKRLEAGSARREIQQSALIEEAIQALRAKESV